jgi:phosphocarrier protein HPr
LGISCELPECLAAGPDTKLLKKTAIIRDSNPHPRQEKTVSSIQGQVQVLDPIGLHARPASQIVKLVKESGLEITIGREGQEFAKANSALRMMALKISTGETLTVDVPTEDQSLADGIIAEIQELLKGE